MKNGFQDSVTAFLGYLVAQAVAGLILGILVAIAVIIFAPRRYIATVAKADRAIQRMDSAPVHLNPWGMYAGTYEVPTDELTLKPLHRQNDPVGQASTMVAPYSNDLNNKLTAYQDVVIPRSIVLVGLIPGVIGLLGMAWGYGRYVNSLVMRTTGLLSANLFKWSQHALGISAACFFAFPFIPYPLTSWVLVVPMVGAVMSLFLVSKYKA